MKKGRPFLLPLLIGILLFILNLMLGPVKIPIQTLFNIIRGNVVDDLSVNILFQIRLPQSLTAIFAGAALATAGLLMQTLFRNPLAGPDVLGISSGASLGVALVTMLTGAWFAFMPQLNIISLIFSALLGALVVLMIILALSHRIKDNAMLLITGLMMGYISSAVVGVLTVYSSAENLQAFTLWGLGTFSAVGWDRMYYYTAATILGLLMALLLPKPLNTLLLGERYARNLGLRISQTRFIVLFCAGLLTAVVTAFCGPIAFIGVATPHITRLTIGGSDHKTLLPANMLIGASVALLCNLIARMPGVEGALPINAVTSLMGAPVVIWVVLTRHKRKYL
ncbi:MAG: iron ABC transporter permease [Bacteroidetes bacterium]|nr:iron ABC transporter permease [Bacteroidota bacterium]